MNTTTLTISNDEINDVIKTVKPVEDSGLLLEGVTETVQNEVKKQKGGFLSMLLGKLGASLLGNILTGREINRAGKGREAIAKTQGRGINRTGEWVLRTDYGSHSSKMDFMYPNLNEIPLSANISNDQQFRLNKINEVKDYYIAEIRQRELMSQNLSF